MQKRDALVNVEMRIRPRLMRGRFISHDEGNDDNGEKDDEADDHNDDNDNGGDGKGADSALPRFYC